MWPGTTYPATPLVRTAPKRSWKKTMPMSAANTMLSSRKAATEAPVVTDPEPATPAVRLASPTTRQLVLTAVTPFIVPTRTSEPCSVGVAKCGLAPRPMLVTVEPSVGSIWSSWLL